MSYQVLENCDILHCMCMSTNFTKPTAAYVTGFDKPSYHAHKSNTHFLPL